MGRRLQRDAAAAAERELVDHAGILAAGDRAADVSHARGGLELLPHPAIPRVRRVGIGVQVRVAAEDDRPSLRVLEDVVRELLEACGARGLIPRSAAGFAVEVVEVDGRSVRQAEPRHREALLGAAVGCPAVHNGAEAEHLCGLVGAERLEDRFEGFGVQLTEARVPHLPIDRSERHA